MKGKHSLAAASQGRHRDELREALTWRVLRRCPQCRLRRRRREPLARDAHTMVCSFPYRERA